MKELNGTTIIGIDHGYGNTKTDSHCFPTEGGGCLVRNFGRYSKGRTVFVEKLCAAAKGYEYMAAAQLKAGEAR